MPRQYRRYFAKFYAYPDSNPTAMLRAPWATSLRCHGALGMPPATLRRVCCDATVTCFRGDLTALVLSMFKTWRRPQRPWRPCCDLQRCHSALWDLTTTKRRSGWFCRSQRGRRPVWLGYNPMWPSDAIWCWRSWSTMVQVRACCLMAPSPYLNQSWPVINGV